MCHAFNTFSLYFTTNKFIASFMDRCSVQCTIIYIMMENWYVFFLFEFDFNYKIIFIIFYVWIFLIFNFNPAINPINQT